METDGTDAQRAKREDIYFGLQNILYLIAADNSSATVHVTCLDCSYCLSKQSAQGQVVERLEKFPKTNISYDCGRITAHIFGTCHFGLY